MRDRPVLMAVLTGVAAVIYGASPVDVIPDILLPLGLADDAVVLTSAAFIIYRILRRRRMGGATGRRPADEIIVEPLD